MNSIEGARPDDAILELRDLGCAVLLVEENAQNALKVADTLAFMELGNIVWSGPREEADMELLAALDLGGGGLHADVWLGDSLGEMPLYYACVDAALLDRKSVV